VALLLLLLVALALVVLWVFAPAFYKGSGALPDAQATATATTRTGILAVFAATIAALGAAAALAELVLEVGGEHVDLGGKVEVAAPMDDDLLHEGATGPVRP
jgi:hypothetical protein